jgi:glycosyltransferase involved in cell wall biosynthesis
MERSTLELVRALAHHGELEITLGAHPDSQTPPGVRLLPWSVEPCPPSYAHWGDGPRKWIDLAIARAFCDIQPLLGSFDIVHDNTSSFAPPIILAASRPNVLCVKTLRLMPYHPSAALSKTATSVRCFLTEYQRKAAGEMGPVVRELPALRGSHAAPCSKRDKTVAISVGRVEPRKGHHVAMEIARVHGQSLTVYGSLADQAYAEELRRLGVHLAGSVSIEELQSVMARVGRLLWTPTVPEPNGRVVWEALSCGLPVTGNDTGALSDLRAMGRARTVRLAGRDLIEAESVGDLPMGYSPVAERYLSIYRRGG